MKDQLLLNFLFHYHLSVREIGDVYPYFPRPRPGFTPHVPVPVPVPVPVLPHPSHETQTLFLKIGAPHKGPDETCYLARSYLELL